MTEKEKAFFEKIFANKAPWLTILVEKEAVSLDKQDGSLEQQVWQRVQSQREEASRRDLRQLQREAMELAAVYRGLSGQLAGRNREGVLQLYRGEKDNAAALAGIGILSRRGGEGVKVWQPGKEAPDKVLERCYHRTRRCVTEYLARSADGEFGLVFEKLAMREKEHCVMLAQVLGSLKEY